MPESSPREFLSQTPSADTTPDAPTPPPDPGTPPPVNPPEPHRFRVGALHAKGGLGEVYRATDIELDRAVALKRIQERFHGDAASLQRFQREAAITARLEHPGIVPIYGLVRDAHGQPAYAMRFVEGQSLLEAIRAFHQTGPDFTSLAFRQLLQRFVMVCQTVAYAHSRRVIHRNLKPANILLGPYGETLVVDWGLAKELPPLRPDQSDKPHGTESLPLTVDARPTSDGLTQVGQILGTAAYMPPEQAKGLLDLLGPQADVYALGAVLYELLTGAMPYAGLSSHDVLARLRRDQPPEPVRQVQPNVPAALAAVARQAMAAKPEDRYPTATALAADVEHWLADEPVRAWREPLTVWLRRWLRHHQTVAATGVVGLAAVALLAGVTAVLLEWSRQAVTAEQIRTEEQRQEAVLAHDEARGVLELVASEGQLHVLEQQESLTKEQERLLKALLAYYQKYVREEATEEPERLRQAKAFFDVGFLQTRLGYKEQAVAAFRRAQEVFAGLVADLPTNPLYCHNLARCHDNLGVLLRELNLRTEAERHTREALRLQTPLATEFPRVVLYRRGLATGHNNLGTVLHEQGKRTEAEQQYRLALQIQSQLVEESPTVPEYRRVLASCHHNLGLLLRELKKWEEGERNARKAVQLRTQLAQELPTEPRYQDELGMSHNNLANLLRNLGKEEAAEQEVRRAIRVQAKLAKDFPTTPKHRRVLAGSHYNLGAQLRNQKKWVEAEQQYRLALQLRTKLAEDFPTLPDHRHELGTSYNNLGTLLIEQGKRVEGEQYLRQALQVRTKLVADFPTVLSYAVDLGAVSFNLARLCRKEGKVQESVTLLDKAVATLQPALDKEPDLPTGRQFLRNAYASRAKVLGELQRHDDAARDWQRATEMNDDPKTVVYFQIQLANSLVRVRESARAVAIAEGLAEVKDVQPDTFYNCACVLSLASVAGKDDDKQRELYAVRAVALLRQAKEAGYFQAKARVKHLDEDHDLDALRQRDDFKQFRAELGKP